MCKGRSAFGKSSAPGSGMTGTWSENGMDRSMKNSAVLLRYRIAPTGKPAQFLDRKLAGYSAGTEMDVVQDIAAATEFDAGGAAEFSDAHGSDIAGGPW